MANYACLDQLPDYSENICAVNRLVGISAVAVINKVNGFTDFTSPTEWAAEIAAGNVKIAKELIAEFPEATEESIPNPRARGSENINIRYNMILNIKDPNVDASNDDFWAQLNKNETIVAWYYFEEQEIRLVEKPVSWNMKPASSPEGGDVQKYIGTASWRMGIDEHPILYDASLLTSIFQND